MTEGSAHADYIYKREKNFKNLYDGADRSFRIVPEVTGKKNEMNNDTMSTTQTNTEPQHENNQLNDENDEKSDKDNILEMQNIGHLIELKQKKGLLTLHEKEQCLKLLNETNNNEFYLSCIIIILLLIVVCLSCKLKCSP